MKDHIKKFLNEEQDPKAIEKITGKLNDLLMKGEEIGYIGVQKKPAITVFPDSIVATNKRLILCKPKNLGLSMDFTDYNWDDVDSVFVKENILGSEFTFTTQTELSISIDYIPKTQARKLYTYSKEQLDLIKNGTPQGFVQEPITAAEVFNVTAEDTVFEEVETEEVTNFAELMPSPPAYIVQNEAVAAAAPEPLKERALSELSAAELFEKLQNYKKLLDNGLILQGEYDAFKKEILGYM